ncbi:MAG: hypothetical protein AAGA56_04295 [Myxococcota bacterium]
MTMDSSAPPFPEALDGDAEDVRWALETANAMWQQQESRDAMRWLRRAAETASERGDDVRSVELALKAADLRNYLEGQGIVLTEAPPAVEERESEGAPDTRSSPEGSVAYHEHVVSAGDSGRSGDTGQADSAPGTSAPSGEKAPDTQRTVPPATPGEEFSPPRSAIDDESDETDEAPAASTAIRRKISRGPPSIPRPGLVPEPQTSSQPGRSRPRSNPSVPSVRRPPPPPSSPLLRLESGAITPYPATRASLARERDGRWTLTPLRDDEVAPAGQLEAWVIVTERGHDWT